MALFDLGSNSGLHVPNDLIRDIPGVVFNGKTSKSSDLSGRISEVKQYDVPALNINCMLFKNITIKELKAWGVSIGDGEKTDANKGRMVIGRGLFKDKTIGIDYSKNILTIENISKQDAVINREHMNSFSLPKEGIVIEANSRYSNYKMVLDTGASISILAVQKVHSKEPLKDCDLSLKDNMTCKMFDSVLTMSSQKFETDMLLFPIDDRFEMDGILGGDFFNQFFVELNFSNNTILIRPNKSNRGYKHRDD